MTFLTATELNFLNDRLENDGRFCSAFMHLVELHGLNEWIFDPARLTDED